MKKLVLVLSTGIVLGTPFFALADHNTSHTIQQIQAQINALQQQVQSIQQQVQGGGGGSISVPQSSQPVQVPESPPSTPPLPSFPIPIPIPQPPLPMPEPPIFDDDRSDDEIFNLSNLKINFVSPSPQSGFPVIINASRPIYCTQFQNEESERGVVAPCPQGDSYHIRAQKDTVLLLANRTRATFNDFIPGDRINVFGFFDPENRTIDALIVRNLSRSAPKPPPKKSFINMVSPNGGEVWQIGSNQTINWDSANAPNGSWVALFLTNGPHIAQGLPVQGTYSWKVPSDYCAGDVCGFPMKAGSNYKIEVRLYTGPALCTGLCPPSRQQPELLARDFSDAPFSIVDKPTPPPERPVNLLFPNGGEIWTRGTTQNITWFTQSPSVSAVDIDLLSWSRPCVSTVSEPCPFSQRPEFAAAISRRTPNDGVFEWNVGNVLSGSLVPGGSYVIRITNSAQQGQYDQSDAPFSIVAEISEQVLPYDSDKSPAYDVPGTLRAITPQNYPDLFVKGVAKGNYIGSDRPVLYGVEPNPTWAKQTTDPFTTYYDHCASERQLNEGYITSARKIGAIGISPPSGYVCREGAFVASTASSLPDLEVSGLQVVPSQPVVGQEAQVRAIVTNRGNARADDIRFTGDLGFQAVHRALPGKTCSDGVTLNPGGSCVWSLGITYSSPVTNNSIVFSADPSNRIQESNEFNNTQRITFNIVAVTSTPRYPGFFMEFADAATNQKKDSYLASDTVALTLRRADGKRTEGYPVDVYISRKGVQVPLAQAINVIGDAYIPFRLTDAKFAAVYSVSPDDYLILVCPAGADCTPTGTKDRNSVLLRIISPETSNVFSPAEGEQWIQGDTRTIRWTAPSAIKSVALTINGKTSPFYVYTIAQKIPNTGAFEWRGLKDIFGSIVRPDRYTVRLLNADGITLHQAAESKEFTISAAGASRRLLTVSPSQQVPEQNILAGMRNQIFGGFDVEVAGEPIVVRQVVLRVAVTGTGGTKEDITSFQLFDENGNVVAGPTDMREGVVSFANTVVFQPGKHAYAVKGTVGTRFANNQTITLSTIPSEDWRGAVGQVSASAVVPQPSTLVTANSVIVKTPVLRISLGPATPPSQLIVAGTKQVPFAVYQLDARESSEDVAVTAVLLRLTAPVDRSQSSLNNCRLYDNITSLTTGAHVVNPTPISEDAASYRFVFDALRVIPPGTVKNVTLKCDMSAGTPAGTSYAWGLDASAFELVSGLVSGVSIAPSVVTAQGNIMTVTQGGLLSVNLDANSPGYQIVVAGTANVELLRLKINAAIEEIDLRQIAFQLSDTERNTPNDLAGRKVTLWDALTGQKISEAMFATGDTALSTLIPPGAFRVPRDGSRTLVVRGDISSISPTGPITQPGDVVKVDYDGDVAGLDGTYGVGVSSGIIIIPVGSDTATPGVRIE